MTPNRSEAVVTARQLHDYAYSMLPRRTGADSRAAVRAYLVEQKIRSPRFGDLPYSDGEVWLTVGDRTCDRFVHGFLFLADWTQTLEEKSTDAAHALLELVSKWAELMGFDPSAAPHPMAYHDETTAQRLKYWLLVEPYVAAVASQGDIDEFHSFIDQTAQVLIRDDFHAGLNNHGMFQDLALRHYADLAHWTDESSKRRSREVALERLQSYFGSCFTPDGVHVENAPSYHQMISQHVTEHVGYLRLTCDDRAEELAGLLHSAAKYATHVVTPQGRYPLLSDSVSRPLRGHAGRVFESPEFDYAVTQGRSGRQPQENTLLLPRSGYAVHRSAWGDPNATWVLFTAAYNADYHKHSDDLSLLIHSGGQPILSEAGPYGYNYKDPLTKFGFSQFGHNNVVVDGRSVNRTDALADAVRMTEATATELGFHATAETGRLREAWHQREVEASTTDEYDEVLVHDRLVSELEEDRTWEMFWNFAPDLTVVPHGQGFEVYRGSQRVMDALFQADVPTQVSVHRGEMSPRALGWHFPEFGSAVAAPVVRVAFVATAARIETRFALRGNFNYADLSMVDGRILWERSETEPQLNYLFDPTGGPGAPLVVVLSAIGTPGFFTYNYRSALRNLPVNALYILDDFGDQGGYYLRDHGDSRIVGAVQALVEQVRSHCGVDRDGVVFAGSSKGGAGALFHGIKYQAGAVVVGAPQTRIGYFLSRPHPNVVEFMTGGRSSEHIEELDQILFDVVTETSELPPIHFLVGEGDHHYKSHALPWVEHVRKHGHSVDLTVLPGTPHAEIGPVYRDYLTRFVGDFAQRWSSGPATGQLAALPGGNARSSATLVPLWWNDHGTLRLRVVGSSDTRVAIKVFRGTELVAEQGYSKVTEFEWADLGPGRYRARVFYRAAQSAAQAVTTPWCQLV